jgi:hypothetical protein
MFDLSCAIPMSDLLRLSLPVRIRTIGNIRLLLRNLVNRWMTVLLILSLLPVAYVLVVLLHTLTIVASQPLRAWRSLLLIAT